MGLETSEPDLASWRAIVERMDRASEEVVVGIVGKYIDLPDAYLSVAESLRHAAAAQDVKVTVRWIPSEQVDGLLAESYLDGLHGIVVPGGFGSRGVEGKVQAARYARERGVPYLGLCLGLQAAVIEFARAVVGVGRRRTVPSSSRRRPTSSST